MTYSPLPAISALAVLVSATIYGLAVSFLTGDVVGAALTVLVVTLTAVVQVFSIRHLRGDPRSGRFLVLSAVFAAATVWTVTATNVLLLAAGWSIASIAMLMLIATGGSAQTSMAVRRADIAFVIGDLALWAAVLIVVTSLGTSAITALSRLDTTAAAVVGTLVATAAVARAASVPFHGWLPATVATTTPVSALLHAGFVNAGALLLFRFDAVPSLAAPLVAGVAGALTVVLAGAALLTRPDVKGKLVQSTAAQMGFMLLACSLGAFAIAFIHVIGHALFKASLFLGAGSAIERALVARRAQPRSADLRPRVLTLAGVLVVAATALAGTDAWSRPSAVLLLFVLATALLAAWRLSAADVPSIIRFAMASTVAGALVTYLLAVASVDDILQLSPPSAAMPAGLAIATFVAAAAVSLLARSRGSLAERAYVFALGWGRPPLPSPPSSTPHAIGPREYRSFS